MTRDKAKSLFVIHTNGEDEWIKVSKRTYGKMIDMVYDYHETRLEKACEILQNANMAEIERHFAECKAKDERIAELEAMVQKMKCCENCISNTYFGSAQYCTHPVEVESMCRRNKYSEWKLRQRG